MKQIFLGGRGKSLPCNNSSHGLHDLTFFDNARSLWLSTLKTAVSSEPQNCLISHTHCLDGQNPVLSVGIMAGKYMQPHMRKQAASSSLPANPTLEREPEDGYTTTELANQFDCKHKVGTLNGSSVLGKDWDHSSLAFIVLFRDQHPQWPPTIFCKTNLNLLPLSPGAKDGGLDSKGLEIVDRVIGKEATSGPLSGPIPLPERVRSREREVEVEIIQRNFSLSQPTSSTPQSRLQLQHPLPTTSHCNSYKFSEQH